VRLAREELCARYRRGRCKQKLKAVAGNPSLRWSMRRNGRSRRTKQEVDVGSFAPATRGPFQQRSRRRRL
jgi:hypothetical protein